jgi:HSP20 family protein
MASKDRESREVQAGSQSQQPARRANDPFRFNQADFFSNPFAVMRRMHEEMDRIFAEGWGRSAGSSAMGGMGSWAPAVEVSERNNELNVCAELPGLRPDDVQVEVTDDALVIQGERKHEQKEEQGGRFHSERSYGRFYRTVPLPEGADPGNARAEFKNGELRVKVPIHRQEQKRRQIPIGGASAEK